ncbi:hypothetical protein [Paenibacillus taiwanensis]|uniref:hypothetical protein n=1 Tax=Paenibacillus taiwanensis TaxID=401638 RepID=UPI0004281550|nr:hypothetical protein [Paenibacillus taiwanensis]
MRENILPFSQPQLYGFLGHAYVLGALQDDERCMDWFYTNYVQLHITQQYIELGEYRLDFYPDLLIIFGNVPWLDYHRTDKEMLTRMNINIRDFIIDHINRGFYFFSYIDEFYIPNTLCYQFRHMTHDLLVSGYNLDKQTYTVAGFNKDRAFSIREISFEEFETAYNSPTTHNYISMFRKADNYEQTKYDLKNGLFDFDLGVMMESLTEYLHGINSSRRMGLYRNLEPGVYGMKVYEALQHYFKLLAEEKIALDVRPLHLLWEHKKFMVQRIRYLQQHGYLNADSSTLQGYEKMERIALKLRNLLLKYFFTTLPALLDKIDVGLAELHTTEKIVLNQLLDELCVHNSIERTALDKRVVTVYTSEPASIS